MAEKKEIRRIGIEPAENGGHTVEHHYKPVPQKKGRSIGYEYPEAESHVFGNDQHEEMLMHVAHALGLKPKGKVEDKDGDGE